MRQRHGGPDVSWRQPNHPTQGHHIGNDGRTERDVDGCDAVWTRRTFGIKTRPFIQQRMPMIDLKDLRENPDKYRKAAELKRMSVDVAAVLDVDARCLAAQQEYERLRAEQNEASKQIGKLKDPAAKQEAIAKVGAVKSQVKDAEERWKAAEAQLAPLLLQLPQPPDPDVPVGKDDTENVEIKKWGDVRNFEFAPKDHVELGTKLGLIDIERGVKLAGSRSYFLTGMGTLLHQAVLRLAQDMMIERGFLPMTVPVLVRDEAMTGTGYFPLGKEQAYAMSNEDPPKYLVGTAE